MQILAKSYGWNHYKCCFISRKFFTNYLDSSHEIIALYMALNMYDKCKQYWPCRPEAVWSSRSLSWLSMISIEKWPSSLKLSRTVINPVGFWMGNNWLSRASYWYFCEKFSWRMSSHWSEEINLSSIIQSLKCCRASSTSDAESEEMSFWKAESQTKSLIFCNNLRKIREKH